MFVAIPDTMLAAIAVTLKAEGFILAPKCDVRGNIVRIADRDYPRTDGNHWRFPKGYTLKAVFYPAFEAAEGVEVKASGKAARKASGKAPAVKAQGARNHKPDCQCGMCLKIRGKAQAQTVKAQSGKAAPKQAAAQASGKLSEAQITMLAEAAAQAAVKAILAAI